MRIENLKFANNVAFQSEERAYHAPISPALEMR
jgi:hypothetical protein